MASLDRPAIVELLGRLGEDNEQTVVQAARELHAKVAQSGLTWDDLLRPESEIGGADAESQECRPTARRRASDADQPVRNGGRAFRRRQGRGREDHRPSARAQEPLEHPARGPRRPQDARSSTAPSTRRTAAISAPSPSASAPEARRGRAGPRGAASIDAAGE